ncbi:MAG: hypothetical protein LBI17_03450 [Rickettsiales bacterium]|nr:hypothetical protein [Rickettsiales bacterium]
MRDNKYIFFLVLPLLAALTLWTGINKATAADSILTGRALNITVGAVGTTASGAAMVTSIAGTTKDYAGIKRKIDDCLSTLTLTADK